MLKAISNSIGRVGKVKISKAARPKVRLWATVNAVTTFTMYPTFLSIIYRLEKVSGHSP